MVKYMLAYDGIEEPAEDNTHANRIRILRNNDLLLRYIVSIHYPIITYLRFAAKNSFISVAHSSAISPLTTTVLGCRAEPAYF